MKRFGFTKILEIRMEEKRAVCKLRMTTFVWLIGQRGWNQIPEIRGESSEKRLIETRE